MDRNVLLAVAAAQEAWADAAIEEFDPARVGHPLRLGDRRHRDDRRAAANAAGARAGPRLAVLHPVVLVDTASGQIAIQLGHHGAELRPRLRLRDRLDRGRRGRRD